jgi:hypothetical protein
MEKWNDRNDEIFKGRCCKKKGNNGYDSEMWK